jgi:transcriptional regulator with XRE-family HTH domain
MVFADKLYSLRTQVGYSQEQLAEKLGVSRQAISKWELGTALPDTDKVVAMSEFFGVSSDFLLKEHIHVDSNASLDRVVLKFLGTAKDMDAIADELVDIMKDGVIDETERERLNVIMDTLDSIVCIIDEIKCKMHA